MVRQEGEHVDGWVELGRIELNSFGNGLLALVSPSIIAPTRNCEAPRPSDPSTHTLCVNVAAAFAIIIYSFAESLNLSLLLIFIHKSLEATPSVKSSKMLSYYYRIIIQFNRN
ncbi:Paired box protein [Dirofilaria immitis]